MKNPAYDETIPGGGLGSNASGGGDDGKETVLAGRYRRLRRLGGGGMGEVFLVEDMELRNRRFAVKMIPAILVANDRAYEQIKNEALVSLNLVHPNIVQVRAVEKNDGAPFIVMDYVEGESLADIIARKGRLTEAETLEILRPIAAALDYAHSKKVIHRDIKPSNIMVAKDGTPVVLDFGIAREIKETMTRMTGNSISGTLLYMSPEQLDGEKPSRMQDVYSFAATAYECLAGEAPFARGDIAGQIRTKPARALPKGVAIATGIMAGLAKSPAKRPASCAAVLSCKTARKSGIGAFFKFAAALAVVAGGAYLGKMKYDEALAERENARIEAATKAREAEEAQKRAEEENRKLVEEKQRVEEFARQRADERDSAVRQAEAKAEREREELEKRLEEAQRKIAKAEQRVQEVARQQESARTTHTETQSVSTSHSSTFVEYSGATKEYVVKAGDYLSKISRDTEVPVAQIMELNGLTGNTLRIGQKLKIPAEKQVRTTSRKTATIMLPGGAKMEMIYCEPGEFMMGSPDYKLGSLIDRKQHNVRLTKGFWLGKYEVTQAQWQSVMGNNPSNFKGDDRPVEGVSWEDCQKFIAKINAAGTKHGTVRLPTEAEWEYACRAGTTGPYHGELDRVAWHAGNSDDQAHPVGQKQSNAWGFYDMHGNVWEWCNDWYGEYPSGAKTTDDPIGPKSGSYRIMRGGGWSRDVKGCRSDIRFANPPTNSWDCLGFRLCCSAEQ